MESEFMNTMLDIFGAMDGKYRFSPQFVTGMRRILFS